MRLFFDNQGYDEEFSRPSKLSDLWRSRSHVSILKTLELLPLRLITLWARLISFFTPINYKIKTQTLLEKSQFEILKWP